MKVFTIFYCIYIGPILFFFTILQSFANLLILRYKTIFFYKKMFTFLFSNIQCTSITSTFRYIFIYCEHWRCLILYQFFNINIYWIRLNMDHQFFDFCVRTNKNLWIYLTSVIYIGWSLPPTMTIYFKKYCYWTN